LCDIVGLFVFFHKFYFYSTNVNTSGSHEEERRGTTALTVETIRAKQSHW